MLFCKALMSDSETEIRLAQSRLLPLAELYLCPIDGSLVYFGHHVKNMQSKNLMPLERSFLRFWLSF